MCTCADIYSIPRWYWCHTQVILKGTSLGVLSIKLPSSAPDAAPILYRAIVQRARGSEHNSQPDRSISCELRWRSNLLESLRSQSFLMLSWRDGTTGVVIVRGFGWRWVSSSELQQFSCNISVALGLICCVEQLLILCNEDFWCRCVERQVWPEWKVKIRDGSLRPKACGWPGHLVSIYFVVEWVDSALPLTLLDRDCWCGFVSFRDARYKGNWSAAECGLKGRCCSWAREWEGIIVGLWVFEC